MFFKKLSFRLLIIKRILQCRSPSGSCPALGGVVNWAGPYYCGGVLDLWPDGEPVYSLELGVGDLPYFLVAAVGAHCIDPCDKFSPAQFVDSYIVVLSARSNIDEAAFVRQLCHWLGRYRSRRVALVERLDQYRIGDACFAIGTIY